MKSKEKETRRGKKKKEKRKRDEDRKKERGRTKPTRKTQRYKVKSYAPQMTVTRAWVGGVFFSPLLPSVSVCLSVCPSAHSPLSTEQLSLSLSLSLSPLFLSAFRETAQILVIVSQRPCSPCTPPVTHSKATVQ
jgi:hypothetical protein